MLKLFSFTLGNEVVNKNRIQMYNFGRVAAVGHFMWLLMAVTQIN